MALYFMPKDSARIIAPWAYFGCFVVAISMLIQLYPFNWAGHCQLGRPLCGDVLCTVRGEWHIAWLLPTNGIGNSLTDNAYLGRGFIGYPLMAFFIPSLYGSWRFILFSWIAGPWLASLTTNNINEWPAVWCLFSIGLVLAIIKTPLRYHLHVGDPWWMMIWKWWKRRKEERLIAATAAVAAEDADRMPIEEPAE